MSDRLYYFSKSANKPVGQGANEFVSNPSKYSTLNLIHNWRQMLSNFWVAPFEINGARWNSVEHLFQGYKINLADPTAGFNFSLNCGSPLSRSGGDEAQKNRKLRVLTFEQLQQWEGMKDTIMKAGLYAKFSQNNDLRKVLLATQDAELWHGAARTAPSRQYLLEQVRSELSPILISIDQIQALLQNGQIRNFEMGTLPTFYDKSGKMYVVQARYDSRTNQLFPL